jgi:hypothetical protein
MIRLIVDNCVLVANRIDASDPFPFLNSVQNLHNRACEDPSFQYNFVHILSMTAYR